MSSSSTTACSRSSSPSPATPESTDASEQVFSPEDLSAWCNSLATPGYANEDEQRPVDASHANVGQMLKLEDLLQDGLYQEAKPIADQTLCLNPLTLSKLALPQDHQTSTPSALSSSALSQVAVAVKPAPLPPSQPRPDPALTAQRVVYPPKEACQNLPIMIPNIPEAGTKSRVETQVRLTVDLAHASASSGEPFKYDRVGTWKWLRLPRGTSTKKRTRKEGRVDASPEDMLYLTAEVTCAAAPHTRVTCCTSCQAREAKRVARKIAARVRPSRSDVESQDEAPFIPGRGMHEDASNIVQFNCPEVLDFSGGSVILPLRITCYCRHHREKTGFNVHFTMLDRYGRVIGTGVTRPIMITDDHKTTGAQKVAQDNEMALGESSDMGGSAKRKKTTASERVKKRTKPYDIEQSAGRTVRRGSSANADSPLYAASPSATRSSSPLQSYTHSQLSAFSPVDSRATLQSAFDFNIPAPDDAPTPIDSDVRMVQEAPPEAVTTIHELTSSFLPPSTTDGQITLDPNQTVNVPSHPAPFFMFAQNPPPPMLSLPVPKIHRLIPASGPTFGGIEVTVLGANFHPSMQLNLLFGGSMSTSTQRWSDNTLVCLLPPRADPGTVTVWFEGVEKTEDGIPPCLFTYTDETDRALMELALQVVGLKMTGKIEDARNVAMRIVGNANTEGADGTAPVVDSAMQLASGADVTPSFRRLLLSRAGNNGDFERVLLDFLSILDHTVDKVASPQSAAISHPTPSGQTLLHLAALAKFPVLVKFLVSHGVDVDARDRNGCTALYLAAVARSAECARVLLEAGADMEVVDATGKTPAEVAPVGFFDFALSDCDTSHLVENEEEAAWGDAEEESDDEPEIKSRTRRRVARKSALSKRRSSHALAEQNSDASVRTGPRSSESKKAMEARMPDEKQVASFMETLQRAFAQWQHPQGMIPNMPAALHNLPIPQIPNLPGIPAWNTLQQMPAVFPVFVPIPALANLWGDRRADDKRETTRDERGGAEAEPPLLPLQDWRGFWEKWIAQAGATLRPANETIDAPPAYSPRFVDEDSSSQVKQEHVGSSTLVKRNAGLTKPSARHVEQPTVAVSEQELDAYVYRPAHKPLRKQKKKHDRMLILFWIPILMIGLVWACFQFMRMAFHATRAMLVLKAGMKV